MRDRRSGFTLVETLVTLTIGTLLVAATVSATRALTTARAGVDRRTQRVAQARRAMEAIVAGLRNVSRDPPDNRPLIVGRGGGRGAGNDAISFLAIEDRRVRPEGAESDFHEMSFFLARSGTKGPPRLVRRRDHAFDEHPEEGGIATVVAEGILSLSFEYYSAGEWYPEWRATEPRPPQAVRVTLVAASPSPDESWAAPEITVLSCVVPIRANEPRRDRGGGSGWGAPGNPTAAMNAGGPPG